MNTRQRALGLVGLIAVGALSVAAGPREQEDVTAPAAAAALPPTAPTYPYDPAVNTSQGVTNSAISPNVQPYVWMAGSTGKLLFKNPDSIGTNGWIDFGVPGTIVNSGVAAVSWTDGNTPRERIYYTKANTGLHQFNYDNNSGGDAPLTQISGYTLEQNVAAGTWVNGLNNNTQTVNVVVAAKNNSNSLRICSYLGTGTGSPSPAGWCTSQDTLSTTRASDIAAVPSSSQAPGFFFVDLNNKLGDLDPGAFVNGSGTYTWNTLNSPDSNPLRPSVWAGPGHSGFTWQVVAVSYDLDADHAWVGLISAGTHTVQWAALPKLPNAIAVLNNSAISGVNYTIGSNTYTLVSIVGSDGRLYRITATNGSFPSSWQAGIFPGGGDLFQSVGVTTVGSSGYPRTFLVSGYNSTYTLAEYQDNGTPVFRDHIRLDLGDLVAVPNPANESSGFVGAAYGFASAIRQSPVNVPWTHGLSETTNSINTWEQGYVETPVTSLNPPYSTYCADGTTAVGGTLLHFCDLEFDLEYVNSRCQGPDTAQQAQVVYRRGTSASAIAAMTNNSPGLYIVDIAGSDMDHPSLGLTSDPYSNSDGTVHIVYNGDSDAGPQDIKYWDLQPDGGQAGPVDITSSFGSSSPPVVIVGANQTPYAYTVNTSATHSYWPTICRLNPDPPGQGAGPCGLVTNGQGSPPPNDDPNPKARFIYYGVQSSQQQGICLALPAAQCTSVKPPCYTQCFQPQQGIAIAADLVNTTTFYAAYQALDPNSPNGADLSIYITFAQGSYTTWGRPIQVSPVRQSGDKTNYLNPAITVDYSGTIVITYSAILSEDDSSDQSGDASVLFSWGTTTNLSNWTIPSTPLTTWNANSLPFHCLRNTWFLGEYHTGSVAGAGAQAASRAYQIYPYSILQGPGDTQQRGRFFSQWAM